MGTSSSCCLPSAASLQCSSCTAAATPTVEAGTPAGAKAAWAAAAVITTAGRLPTRAERTTKSRFPPGRARTTTSRQPHAADTAANNASGSNAPSAFAARSTSNGDGDRERAATLTSQRFGRRRTSSCLQTARAEFVGRDPPQEESRATSIDQHHTRRAAARGALGFTGAINGVDPLAPARRPCNPRRHRRRYRSRSDRHRRA